MTEDQFDEFILPHLSNGKRGPKTALSFYKLFNYILSFLYTGCQWKELFIEKDASGKPEIHYTRVFRVFQHWERLIKYLSIQYTASTRIICWIPVWNNNGRKKRGDSIGYSGHKRLKGDKVVAFCDRHGNVVAPFVTAPGNQNECPLFPQAFQPLRRIAKAVGFQLSGSVMSLDSIYDSRANRKMIFNHGMTLNIPENQRNRKSTKRGRKRLFEPRLFLERFFTIERVFGWEDKFKRLLIRFEHLSHQHYALKTIAYTMINLRHFC
ncbi:transposase [Spartinivicinus poritis]|uniref:Transposase n=1 Tax=Spartinivicinus poritis TaxID=2994640 RepID=A0ABT5UHU6_9GAMM|nr:transposase [Spartinivicinus sp. A2-2]MDE1465954.1 transposase [Spartinivicinus sp. A2-2]